MYIPKIRTSRHKQKWADTLSRARVLVRSHRYVLRSYLFALSAYALKNNLTVIGCCLYAGRNKLSLAWLARINIIHYKLTIQLSSLYIRSLCVCFFDCLELIFAQHDERYTHFWSGTQARAWAQPLNSEQNQWKIPIWRRCSTCFSFRWVSDDYESVQKKNVVLVSGTKSKSATLELTTVIHLADYAFSVI